MSTPEEIHRDRLNEGLLIEFGEFAEFIGGWQSVAGQYLDGRLTELAERLRKAGMQEWPKRTMAKVGI